LLLVEFEAMRMNQKVFILSTVVKYSVYAMTKDTNTIQIYITLQASQSLVIFLCNARVQLHRQRFRVLVRDGTKLVCFDSQ
jgi:hypothetical protein